MSYAYDDDATSSDSDSDLQIRPKAAEEPSGCCAPCERLMNWLRDKFWYHLIAFLAHYIGLAAAIFATVASYFFHSSVTSASGALNLFLIVGLVVDIALLMHHYERKTFFPYCAAPHLLFMVTGERCDPCPPPRERLFISEKLLIFWQGFIFVVVPLNNLIASLRAQEGKDHSDIQKTIIIVTLIQLGVTFVGWVLFFAYYCVFICEVLVRFFCCPCLQFREAEKRYRTVKNHILASDKRDSLPFYTAYAWLYENM